MRTPVYADDGIITARRVRSGLPPVASAYQGINGALTSTRADEKSGRVSGAVSVKAGASDVLAGLLLAVVTFAYSLSFGALIYSGRLAEYIGLGVATAILSAALATLIVSRLSSFRYALAGPDTPVVAILSALAISVAAATPAYEPAAQVLANVTAAMMVCCAATAGLLLAVGCFRLSKWVRFIPYTVVAGFLAASGWFLIDGTAAMLTGLPLHQALLDIGERQRWDSPLVAAVLFGGGIYGLQAITRSNLAAPVGALSIWAGVEALTALGAIDREALHRTGWLLRQLPEGQTALAVQAVFDVAPQASSMIGNIPEILSVAAVAALAILLNTTGLEVDGRTDADLDREYRASGLANIAVGAIGGLPSNLSLNRTIMNRQAGGQSRFSGLVVAAACGAGALVAADAAAAIPGPILGGLVLFMGFSMLWRWLVASARHFNRPEHLSVVGIFALIVIYGYIAGAALGVVAACTTFAFTYSRAAFVRQRLSRADYASYVKRSPDDERLLLSHGARIQIFQLQGYIFFGTAHQLGQQIQAVIDREPSPVTHLLLDFRHVTGSDSSASFSLIKVLQMLQRIGVRACFTGLDGPQASRMQSMLASADDLERPAIFDRLDYGLEWCEDAVLTAVGGGVRAGDSAQNWLARELGGPDLAGRLLPAMERREYAAGETICRQGEPSDLMLFLVRGRVSILLERPPEPSLRLRSMMEQTIIGEIGFYKGEPRSASVIADLPSEILLLSRLAFEKLQKSDPVAADALHCLVVRILADRLTFASKEIAALHG